MLFNIDVDRSGITIQMTSVCLMGILLTDIDFKHFESETGYLTHSLLMSISSLEFWYQKATKI